MHVIYSLTDAKAAWHHVVSLHVMEITRGRGEGKIGWVITEELVTAISRVMSANPEMSRTRDLNFLGYARKPRGAYLQSTSRPRFPGVPLLSSKMTLIQYKVIKKES